MLSIDKSAAKTWAPNWAGLRDDDLHRMHEAGQEVEFWLNILRKTGDSLVSDLLRGVPEIQLDAYYPDDTVMDVASGCQYFFHAHTDRPEEYGHIHTYTMASGIPNQMRAMKPATNGDHEDKLKTHCHHVAIVMSDKGMPVSLFTINQWSSQEAVYSVEQIKTLLDRWDISHAAPSYPVNRWVSAFLRLMRPQIVYLLEKRVETQKQWAIRHPGCNPFADEDLEVTSETDICVEKQIAGVRAEIERRQLIDAGSTSSVTPELA